MKISTKNLYICELNQVVENKRAGFVNFNPTEKVPIGYILANKYEETYVDVFSLSAYYNKQEGEIDDIIVGEVRPIITNKKYFSSLEASAVLEALNPGVLIVEREPLLKRMFKR